jgi:hypothetical protein
MKDSQQILKEMWSLLGDYLGAKEEETKNLKSVQLKFGIIKSLI